MEYSLQELNKISKLENLTLINFIENLNLIGLEIDDIFIECLKNPLRISDIKLLIKIPANRDDLLNENILLNEFLSIFLFQVYKTWENLQKKYFFLLKQKYFYFSNYSVVPIKSDLDCFLTYLIKIENYKNNSTPTWIKNKLKIGTNEKVTLLESIIDLTIVEWGQNFNTLDSCPGKIKIERLKQKQHFFFNDNNYSLNEGTIVLMNEKNEILSVLGILNQSLNEQTVLLEGSFYDIDKNFLGLNDVNTKLSFRYLRRSFLSNFKSSFQRMLTLLEIVTGASINGTIYKSDSKNLQLFSYKLLKVNKDSFKKFLNIENYDSTIFEKINLKIVCKTQHSLYFNIPDFRKDLSREIDLIEEYAKFIAYKNFKEIFPKSLTSISLKNKNKKYVFIKQFFLSASFNEILTNSLESEQKIKSNSIVLQNPLNSDFSILRSSLLDNITEVFLKNLKFGVMSLKFFEIGRIYKKDNNIVIEEEHLSLIFPSEIRKNGTDDNLHFFVAKGFIENFLSYFTQKIFLFKNVISTDNNFHPNKSLQILDNNEIIGYFGEINPKYKKLFSLKQNIYLFELNLEAIKDRNLKSSIKIYKEYSKYPSITKDLSILISKTTNFYNLKNVVLKEIENLKTMNFFDIYFDNKEDTQISLGIRLEFQSLEKTLVNEEIENEIKKLILFLKKDFGAELKG